MKQVILAGCGIAFLIVNTQQPAQPSQQRGASLYKKYCLTCHQADGSGVPRLNPPLIKAPGVTGEKNKLIQWVLEGTVEKAPIEGEYYTNNMPAQNYLTDQEIADVLTYIRGNFGNKASAVTSAEVKTVRTATK